jgi:hypothetical protein
MSPWMPLCGPASQSREYPTVAAGSDPPIGASDPPGQHHEDGQTADDRVDTDRTRQQEVHVHEDSEEGGNPGQHTEDQAKADKQTT